jgi:branched-chain amino acid transport system permease protein
MDKFLQILIDALAVGTLYGLIALGYTMVYGVLQFINFSHASIVMIGAWTGLFFLNKTGWSEPSSPIFAACVIMLVSICVCVTLGLLIEFLCYRPLRNAPRINALITAIGISIFLERLSQFKFLFGTEPTSVPRLIPDIKVFTIGDVSLRLIDLIVILGSLVLMVLVDRFVHKTKTGLAMRAIAHDTKTASLMGVSPNKVIAITFILGSGLAAIAGQFYVMRTLSINQPAHPTWTLLGLKAFVAAVIGGIGNIRGAMVGGLLIAMLEIFGAGYLTPQLRDVYVFVVLIIVLLVRPSGLFNKPVIEKV